MRDGDTRDREGRSSCMFSGGGRMCCDGCARDVSGNSDG